MIPRLDAIRIMGVQRTGTNWLRVLLEQNATTAVVNGGGRWKHDFDPDAMWLPSSDLHLVLSKDPYKWAQSLQRYSADIAWSTGKSFENLFNHPTMRSHSDCIITDSRGSEMCLRGMIRLYNTFYSRWLAVAERNPRVRVVAYEAVLRDPADFLVSLVPFGYAVNAELDTEVDPRRVSQSEDFPRERVADYLNPASPTSLSPQQLAVIHDELDRVMAGQLGYAVRAPCS